MSHVLFVQTQRYDQTYPLSTPALRTVELAATRTPAIPRETRVLRQPLPASSPAFSYHTLPALGQNHPSREKSHRLAFGRSSAVESPCAHLLPAASAQTLPTR